MYALYYNDCFSAKTLGLDGRGSQMCTKDQLASFSFFSSLSLSISLLSFFFLSLSLSLSFSFCFFIVLSLFSLFLRTSRSTMSRWSMPWRQSRKAPPLLEWGAKTLSSWRLRREQRQSCRTVALCFWSCHLCELLWTTHTVIGCVLSIARVEELGANEAWKYSRETSIAWCDLSRPRNTFPEGPGLGKRKHTPPCSSTELCFAEKKGGLQRKDFGGGYGFPGFYRVFVSTTGLESFSFGPEKFPQWFSFGGGCVPFFLLCRIEKIQSREARLKKSSFQYRMKFSIGNGFFIPGPSLAAEKQGLGLKFSIENESFKPRMKISSENEHFVRGGMAFWSPGPLGFLGVQSWSPFVTRKSGHIWRIWAEMTQTPTPKSNKVAQIHLPECNSAKIRQILLNFTKFRQMSAKCPPKLCQSSAQIRQNLVSQKGSNFEHPSLSKKQKHVRKYHITWPRSEKLQTESSPDFSIFFPEFCPEFCSRFSPIFLRSFRALFCGKTETRKKFTKNPCHFSMQNSQTRHEPWKKALQASSHVMLAS